MFSKLPFNFKLDPWTPWTLDPVLLLVIPANLFLLGDRELELFL
jgi:hypothetical protein